jgi:hypothetical protein
MLPLCWAALASVRRRFFGHAVTRYPRTTSMGLIGVVVSANRPSSTRHMTSLIYN